MDKRYGILIVSVTILVLSFVVTASATNWSVDGSGGTDFTRIQDAINNAKAGDTIIVYSGVYYENVVVDKSVTLMGNGYPVVDASGSGSAITLTADGITLVGFTATNAGSSWLYNDAGIKVISNSNNITGNNASNNNWEGIYLSYSCNNNIITGNNVSNNNEEGIGLYDSSNNNITGNNVSNNNEEGIYLYDSSNNRITGNNVSNNNMEGIHLWTSNNNAITGNNVSNNKGIGIINLWGSSNNCITGNNVSNNKGIGIISLWGSSNNNTITGNNVCNNGKGIWLADSSNNTIYLNNFINNTDNVDSYDSTNIWNSPLEITYTYDETTYESYVGNYWDDYEGTDADSDGIGNTPCSIDSEKDESDDYPLMKPFENYILLTSAPT
jgi:parallel beta-helix repeat protein